MKYEIVGYTKDRQLLSFGKTSLTKEEFASSVVSFDEAVREKSVIVVSTDSSITALDASQFVYLQIRKLEN